MITFTTDQWYAWVAGFMLPLTRILAVIATAPLLGQNAVPVPVRVGLGIALTVAIAPGLAPIPGWDMTSPAGLLLVVQQIAIGVILGFTVNLVFMAVELAGEVSGLQMGLNFASFYDPVNGAFQPVLAQFLLYLMSLLFVAMDGHLLVIAALADSFNLVPIDPLVHWHGVGWRTLATLGSGLFAEAIQISLPILAALVMTNIALGILTRSAPQLNLFVVGFPLTLGMGFVIQLLSLTALAPLSERYVHQAIENARRIISLTFH